MYEFQKDFGHLKLEETLIDLTHLVGDKIARALIRKYGEIQVSELTEVLDTVWELVGQIVDDGIPEIR